MKPFSSAGQFTLILTLGLLVGCATVGSDLDHIAAGVPLTGSLDATDDQLPSGEFYDLYVFNARAGDEYEIRLASDDFDTYLIFIDPERDQMDNDDHDGTNSGLDVSIASRGLCAIGVTSYSAGLTGSYTLTLTKTN